MRREQIRAGQIVGVHGIRGELKVQALERDAEFLASCGTFLLEGRPVTPTARRVHKNQLLLKLPGVEDRTAAEALRGKFLYVRREDVELPAGEYFDEELLGLDVYDGETGACIGELIAVDEYPASKVYTVRGVKEFLVPAVKDAFILDVDLENNRMDIRVWEGMTE